MTSARQQFRDVLSFRVIAQVGLLLLALAHTEAVSRRLNTQTGRVLQSSPCSSSNPFETGQFAVSDFSLANAPLPLTVYAPQVRAGSTSAPVLLFLHGFSSNPRQYSFMLRQIASHGYIVIGPQFQTNFLSTDASGDIASSAAVIQWLRTNYAGARPALPQTLAPDFNKLVLSGHSRGGKVAYGVGARSGSASVGAKALVAFDPVDSSSNQLRLPLNLNGPSLILATGLGPLRSGFLNLFPPCAPAATSYNYFFSGTSSTPVFQFRARDYGHADMLDSASSAGSVCRSRGSAFESMRKFCAGTAVAFMRSVLDGNAACFNSLRTTPSQFPVAVDEIKLK